jgi:hypothetical protein
MIRGQSGDHYILGLAEENIRRLQAGAPIVFKLNEHGLTGPPLTIFVCYGETEEKLLRDLSSVLGPTTVVRDERKNR